MVAVGGRDQDFLYPLVDKGLDIFPGQGREYLFTAELADTFAATVFLVAQYAEINPAFLRIAAVAAATFFILGS